MDDYPSSMMDGVDGLLIFAWVLKAKEQLGAAEYHKADIIIHTLQAFAHEQMLPTIMYNRVAWILIHDSDLLEDFRHVCPNEATVRWVAEGDCPAIESFCSESLPTRYRHDKKFALMALLLPGTQAYSAWEMAHRARRFESAKRIRILLQKCIDRLPAHMICKVPGGKNAKAGNLCMPKRYPKPWMLSWSSVTNNVANQVARYNSPLSYADCWLHPVSEYDFSGYPELCLLRDGEGKAMGLHKLLFFLKRRSTKVPAGMKIGARCHRYPKPSKLAHSGRIIRGRAIPEEGINVACINPSHYTLVYSDKERDGCSFTDGPLGLNGYMCSHTPKCIWTGSEGQRKYCLDYWPPRLCVHGKVKCVCLNACFGCWAHPMCSGTLKEIRGIASRE